MLPRFRQLARLMLMLSIVVLAGATAGARPAPLIDVKPAVGGALITVSLSREVVAGHPTNSVPYTAEPYNFALRPKAPKLSEANIFDSGLALDLDGDGKLSSVFDLICHPDGSASAGKVHFSPLGWPTMAYRQWGKTVIRRLGKRGVQALMYRPCTARGEAFVGISRPGKSITIEKAKGPALMVMVFESVARPKQHGALKLGRIVGGASAAIKRHRVWVYEPIFSSQPGWSEASFALVPLSTKRAQRVRLRLAGLRGGQRYVVIASINTSPGPHQRQRGQVAAKFFRGK